MTRPTYRLFASVATKGDSAVISAYGSAEFLADMNKGWREEGGWSPMSEPAEYVRADEVERMIAEAVEAARRAA